MGESNDVSEPQKDDTANTNNTPAAMSGDDAREAAWEAARAISGYMPRLGPQQTARADAGRGVQIRAAGSVLVYVMTIFEEMTKHAHERRVAAEKYERIALVGGALGVLSAILAMVFAGLQWQANRESNSLWRILLTEANAIQREALTLQRDRAWQQQGPTEPTRDAPADTHGALRPIPSKRRVP